MTARVLVVDDILSNVKLLEAKLTAEYFEVVTAFNGLECLAKMDRERARHRPAGRDDARHGRLRSLPPHQVQSQDRPCAGGDGHRAGPAVRPRRGPGSRRRRFPHQAGRRCRPVRAGALAGAPEDDDRRTAHARVDRPGHGPDRSGRDADRQQPVGPHPGDRGPRRKRRLVHRRAEPQA